MRPARRGTLILSIALLAACGTASPGSSASVRVSNSSTPRAASTVLACRLPFIPSRPEGGAPAGFITVPGGTYAADPTSRFDKGTDGLMRSEAQPVLAGYESPGSYDWPPHRWLPARAQEVSRDGSLYAYSAQGGGSIHDVAVSTGQDRSFMAPAGPDTILYYASEGIYFNQSFEGPPPPGLWLLDPSTGRIQQLLSDKRVDAVGGFAAWIPDVNPADPHPMMSMADGTPLPNQALRRDLNTSALTPWFYQPGKAVNVTAFTIDRRPLMMVQIGPVRMQVWLVPRANQGQQLHEGDQVSSVFGDEHGVWISDAAGVFLWRRSSGEQRVSSMTGTVAGACR